MKFLDRLDRIVRPIAIPNLTQVLIAGQVIVLVASLLDGNAKMLERLPLVWESVFQGEGWRLLSFLFVPFSTSPIWLFFSCYIFFIFGNSLQSVWGYVRYNTFMWLGIILTIAAAAIAPDQQVSSRFLYMSVFLAFATYNPNFELRLFFVIPVKVKFLAYIQVGFYLLALVSGPMAARAMVLASIGNYLVFFAPMLFQQIRNKQRQVQWEAKQNKITNEPRHTCTTCGVNSNIDPKMSFRYCSKCDGERAYCEAHLRDHQHVTSTE
ncbi:MAG: hypothetical protein P8L85_22770 [Rubripirellula sp.]|nr:hypothetical protein [Rubripirellula sp.]